MTDLDAKAITARAAAAIHRITCRADTLKAACDGPVALDFDLARAVLEAAAPAIRQQATTACAQLARDTAAKWRAEYRAGPAGIHLMDADALDEFADLLDPAEPIGADAEPGETGSVFTTDRQD